MSLPSSKGPDHGQLALIKRGYGMFIHFGVNTFNELEWSDGTLPATGFHPSALDCDQWIQTAKEAGFRHVVLTTKHVDGFCLWPSKYTNYSVAAATVKTDIVAAVAKACKKYGVEFGLYYSLWDRIEPAHAEPDPTNYIQYVKNQLTELLNEYGPVCELWFDAAWSKPDAEWRLPELYALIKTLQPGCQVTVNHTIHIPGEGLKVQLPEDMRERDPIRYWPVDFRTKDPNLVRADDPKHYTAPDGSVHYLPFEHTICISDRWNWFQKAELIPARSPDELEELYYWCTANDNALLVNLPPDQNGLIRENEREAIFRTADLLGIRGGNSPLPNPPVNQAAGVAAEADSVLDGSHGADKAVDNSLERTRWAATTTNPSLTLSPSAPFVFDRISLHEYAELIDLGDGFSKKRELRIQSFCIDISFGDVWKTIHQGTGLSPVRVVRFPEKLIADKIRVRITEASAPPSIHLITVADSSTRRAR
jgi:alpha-L-fucosidase